MSMWVTDTAHAVLFVHVFNSISVALVRACACVCDDDDDDDDDDVCVCVCVCEYCCRRTGSDTDAA